MPKSFVPHQRRWPIYHCHYLTKPFTNGWPGWVDLGGWKYPDGDPDKTIHNQFCTVQFNLLNTVHPHVVTDLSINPAWCKLTLPICATPLTLSYAATSSVPIPLVQPLILDDLHRVHVSQRVVFKMALMVWKCINGVAPAHLSDLCISATATSERENLRSASSRTLLVLHVWTAAAQQSFSINGTTTWNSLPPALRAPELSQNAFLRALKMHLFSTTRHRWDVFTRSRRHKQMQWLTYLLT